VDAEVDTVSDFIRGIFDSAAMHETRHTVLENGSDGLLQKEPMITITVAPLHPVTIVAADPRRYHFARLIAVSQRFMIVELRRGAPISQLDVTHVIIEMFGLVGVVRAGTVGIEIDCRNTTVAGKRFLRLEPLDALALKISVRHPAK
jgi:hypothetical protein